MALENPTKPHLESKFVGNWFLLILLLFIVVAPGLMYFFANYETTEYTEKERLVRRGKFTGSLFWLVVLLILAIFPGVIYFLVKYETEEKVFPLISPVEDKPGDRYCANCGTSILPTAKFCEYCGTRQ